MAVLRYPYAALTNETDYLQLDIVKYSPAGRSLVRGRGFASNKTNNSVGSTIKENLNRSSVKEGDGTILLPMPSNLQDGNSVKYADDSLNGLVASVVGDVTKGMSGNIFEEAGRAQTITAFGNIINTALGEPMQKLINRTLAAQAVNIFGGNVTPDQILARQSGEIFNPNMELLFNGVTLRTFKFSFKMTPRNKDESKQVKLIIKSLKQNMAPQASGGTTYLKTPNIFELRYRKGNSNHPFLHRFKQCALTDISVNYTGENIYATYGDATPVSIIMDLTFRELEPIYAQDYSDPKDDTNDLYGGVGY